MLDQIRDQLIQTVQSAPDLASSHLTLGSFYASQLHDFDKARAEELEVIRLEPDAERGDVSLASLYLSRQDFVDSVAELREAVRIAPQGVFEHLALANMLEQAGYDADAIGELQAILARRPNHSVASERLVDLYVQQKDFESAIEELRRSLKSTSLLFSDESLFVSQRWDDETRLAQLLKLNHDLDDAAEQYLYLLRFRPDYPDLHNSYGMLLAQQNRCADAIGEFNQSVRLSDAQNDSSYARSNVALCLSTQKDYDSAARELSSILESEPNSPIAENNVAWVYATADDPKLRNPAEALRLARLAVDSSDRPEAFMLDTLAEALLLNGKPDEALATETRPPISIPAIQNCNLAWRAFEMRPAKVHARILYQQSPRSRPRPQPINRAAKAMALVRERQQIHGRGHRAVHAHAAPNGLCLPREITEHESGHHRRGRLRQQLREMNHHVGHHGHGHGENSDGAPQTAHQKSAKEKLQRHELPGVHSLPHQQVEPGASRLRVHG